MSRITEKFNRKRKGNQRLIFIVAMMALSIMFVVLYFVAADNWVTEVGNNFINLTE